MSNRYLCIAFRFLDSFPTFHGVCDGEATEWPPSPLRAFQAVASAMYHSWKAMEFGATAKPILDWLQTCKPPVVIANKVTAGNTYRIAVPNNDLDLVADAWKRGLEPKKQPAELKAMKSISPVYIRANSDGEAWVRYVLDLRDFADPLFPTLQRAARSITHLGWGIDMVVGDAEIMSQEQVDALPGHRWYPTDGPTNNNLRVPVPGTLEALKRRHEAFLNRLAPDERGNDSFRPVPPLTVFRNVGYRRATDPAPTRHVAFGLIACDGGKNPAFDVARRTCHVAGMMRHAVAEAATRQQWEPSRINSFIHGKIDSGDGPIQQVDTSVRLSYLPLPTINYKLNRVESIRRILVMAPVLAGREIDWTSRVLPGNTLVAEGQGEVAFLEPLPKSDWVYKQYVEPACEWATVTPVILPRHPKKRDGGVEGMIRLAFQQAGFDPTVIQKSEFEVRGVGFLPGNDLASKYIPPKNLSDRPRFHVRAFFPHEMSGPITVGAGRFRGFGLFVHARSRTAAPPTSDH